MEPRAEALAPRRAASQHRGRVLEVGGDRGDDHARLDGQQVYADLSDVDINVLITNYANGPYPMEWAAGVYDSGISAVTLDTINSDAAILLGGFAADRNGDFGVNC